MPKPILLIGLPAEMENPDLINQIEERYSTKIPEYYVICHVTNEKSPTFKILSIDKNEVKRTD